MFFLGGSSMKEVNLTIIRLTRSGEMDDMLAQESLARDWIFGIRDYELLQLC
jgi:hypothetical protein